MANGTVSSSPVTLLAVHGGESETYVSGGMGRSARNTITGSSVVFGQALFTNPVHMHKQSVLMHVGLRLLRSRGPSRQRGESQVVHGTYIACAVHRPGPEMVGGTRLQMGQVHSVRQKHGFIEVRTLPIGGGLAIDELCSGWLIGAPKDGRGGTPNRSRLATGIIVMVAIYLLADRRIGSSIGPGEWIILWSHSRIR